MAGRPREGWSAENQQRAQAAGHPTWEAWAEHLEANGPYAKVCGARNGKGTPCGRPAGHGTKHPGTGRCRHHFGNVPVGPSHPKYKHGRYVTTVAMPSDILARRQAAAEDPHLLSLTEQIATANAKEERLLVRLGTLEAEPVPTRGPDEDPAAFLNRRMAFYQARERLWDDLLLWAEQKRRLVRSEMDLRVAHHDMVTRDQLRLMVDWVGMALREALEEKVADPKERNAAYTVFAHRMRQYQQGGQA
jgi:hypothetical protein